MKNFVRHDGSVTCTAPYDVSSGGGALIGTMFGVAAVDIANGAQGEFDIEGVFDLAKATGQAWTEGAAIYWDNTNKNCTTTSSGNTKIGVAVFNTSTGAMAASGDTVGRVRLNGSF